MQIWRLKQSLIYLVVYFFLGDAFNTTYSTSSSRLYRMKSKNTTLSKLHIYRFLSFAAQATGIYVRWRVQRRWSLNTKTMLGVVAVSIIAANIWGMIGIWTTAIGYHHRWEFWLWNIWYGGMMCPWYSYSQTMVFLLSCSLFATDVLLPLVNPSKNHVLQPPNWPVSTDFRNHTPWQDFFVLLSL